MNNVNLIGRPTRDIEVSTSKDGTPYCAFFLAIKRPKKQDGSDGGADFPRIVAFGKLAETAAEFVGKGDLIAVEASVSTGNFEDNEGNITYTTDFVASRIEFLNLKNREE